MTEQGELIKRLNLQLASEFIFFNSKDYSKKPNSYYSKQLEKFWE